MRTVIDASEDTAVEMVVTEADTPATLTTTLYDLMVAVQDVVGSHNDTLVVATVQHMLRAGRATWVSDEVAFENQPPTPVARQTHAHGGFRLMGRRWAPESLATVSE